MTTILLLIERARSSFWIPPAAAVLAAVIAGVGLPALDASVRMPGVLSIAEDADTARSVLQTIATIAVSIAGISFSVIVVALVLASQQLSPRVLRSFQRHPLNKAVLAVFLGTAAFATLALGAVGEANDEVPDLSIAVALVLAATTLALFVVFLHHVVRSLNASAVIRRIAAEGHVAIEGRYPARVGRPPDDHDAAEAAVSRIVERSACREVRAARAGYLASVDPARLLEAADEADGFVEQKRDIGSFAVTGAVLAVAWAREEELDALAEAVEKAFVLDEERVVDDDIGFPLRQLSDVALKGLSPGVNDPTTAENAMDSVADTLVRIAGEPDPPLLRVSGGGEPRFRATTASLGALVRLGFEQVRRDAAPRPSFSVRLLELLADVREFAVGRVGAMEEIDRQARAVLEHALERAEIPADADLVRAAYERLHSRRP